MTRLLLAPLLLALLAGPLRAELPLEVTVQGRLQDPPGAPLQGLQDLTLRLYSQASGGVELVSEVDAVTLDAAGVFRTVLGDGASLDPASLGKPLWLGVTVDEAGGGSELSPRLPVAPAPLALYAAVAPPDLGPQVVWVGHDGDAAASGAALLAAAAGITDAAASKTYQLRLGPGRFDLGGAGLVLPAYVSLAGEGSASTTMSGSTSGPLLTVGSAAEVRDLALEAPRYGVSVGTAADVRLERLRVAVEGVGASTPRGVDIRAVPGRFAFRDSRVEVADPDADELFGVLLVDSGGVGEFRLQGLDVEVRGDEPLSCSFGLAISAGSPVLVTGTEVLAFNTHDAAGLAIGAAGTDVRVIRSDIEGDGAVNGFGITTSGGLVRLLNTRVAGGTTGGGVCGPGNFDAEFNPLGGPCP